MEDDPHRAMASEFKLLIHPGLSKRPRIVAASIILIYVLEVVTEFCGSINSWFRCRVDEEKARLTMLPLDSTLKVFLFNVVVEPRPAVVVFMLLDSVTLENIRELRKDMMY